MVLDQAPNGRFRGGQVLISPNQVRVITQIRSQVHVPNQVHINPLLCQVLLIIPFGYNTILKHLFTFYYFDHFMQNFQLNWNSLLWFIIISHFFFPIPILLFANYLTFFILLSFSIQLYTTNATKFIMEQFSFGEFNDCLC